MSRLRAELAGCNSEVGRSLAAALLTELHRQALILRKGGRKNSGRMIYDRPFSENRQVVVRVVWRRHQPPLLRFQNTIWSGKRLPRRIVQNAARMLASIDAWQELDDRRLGRMIRSVASGVASGRGAAPNKRAEGKKRPVKRDHRTRSRRGPMPALSY